MGSLRLSPSDPIAFFLTERTFNAHQLCHAADTFQSTSEFKTFVTTSCPRPITPTIVVCHKTVKTFITHSRVTNDPFLKEVARSSSRLRQIMVQMARFMKQQKFSQTAEK